MSTRLGRLHRFVLASAVAKIGRPLCAVAAALAAGQVALSVPSRAGPQLDRILQPACRLEHTCVVRENRGGDLLVFTRAAREVLREGKTLVIDGRCESACVVLADLARPNTCLTPRAEIGVHKTMVMMVIGRRYVQGRAVPLVQVLDRNDLPLSDDIDQWVRSHGGYPTDGMNVLPVQDASRFWPMCE